MSTRTLIFVVLGLVVFTHLRNTGALAGMLGVSSGSGPSPVPNPAPAPSGGSIASDVSGLVNAFANAFQSVAEPFVTNKD